LLFWGRDPETGSTEREALEEDSANTKKKRRRRGGRVGMRSELGRIFKLSWPYGVLPA